MHQGPKSWNTKHVDVTGLSTGTLCDKADESITPRGFVILAIILDINWNLLYYYYCSILYQYFVRFMLGIVMTMPCVFEATGILYFIHFLRIIWHSTLLCTQPLHFSLFCVCCILSLWHSSFCPCCVWMTFICFCLVIFAYPQLQFLVSSSLVCLVLPSQVPHAQLNIVCYN